MQAGQRGCRIHPVGKPEEDWRHGSGANQLPQPEAGVLNSPSSAGEGWNTNIGSSIALCVLFADARIAHSCPPALLMIPGEENQRRQEDGLCAEAREDQSRGEH